MSSSYGCRPTHYQSPTEVLAEMFNSPELHNEGLSSFHYPLYEVSDEELDYFFGSLVHSVGKAVGGVAKTVGGVAKVAGKALSSVQKVIPSQVLTAGLGFTPMGLAIRAGMGALTAAADGKNVFQSAMRSLAGDPVTRFYIDTGVAAARGENLLKAAQRAAQAGIGDLKQSLQFAAMVAPFVPGLGTGVAAALGAANALAAGQPITEALIAAARSAIPGGAVAQMAFDAAMNVARGKNISDALLNSARTQLPGGPAAQAAFDAAVALAKGKGIQDAAFAAAGKLLPPSPYAADALSFVKKVASGENIQKAALSSLGNMVINRIEQQTGPVLSRVRGYVPQSPSGFRPPAFTLPASSVFALAALKRAQSGIQREFSQTNADERRLLAAQITANQRDPNKLTDIVFYARHPELHRKKIAVNQEALKDEWLSILNGMVRPTLAMVGAASTSSNSKGHSGPDATGDADVRAAQFIAAKPVPGIPGTTLQQLIELWRQSIAPEIPMPVLLGFIRFESGGNFQDATHGSPRNHPPFTQPEFYELGLFQTPAGLHGACTTGDYRSCANTPPGPEIPGQLSTWARLCKKIGANPNDWINPVTQARVGLLDLKTAADTIHAAYPDLFPIAGSDWYLRMAVLLPFARGGGFARAFLGKYRGELAKLPEDARWDFLRGKKVPVRGGLWTFDPSNVDKKMGLAQKLGYSPAGGQTGGIRGSFTANEADAITVGRPATVSVAHLAAPITVTIGRFPRYGNSLQNLPPEERSKITQSAQTIVASYETGKQPVRLINLVGHADQDTPRRPAFELSVSLDRASLMRKALFGEIDRISRINAKGSLPFPPYSTRVDWKVSGTGATRLLAPAAQSEAERATNRRVVITMYPLGSQHTMSALRASGSRPLSLVGQATPSGWDAKLESEVEEFCKRIANADINRSNCFAAVSKAVKILGQSASESGSCQISISGAQLLESKHYKEPFSTRIKCCAYNANCEKKPFKTGCAHCQDRSNTYQPHLILKYNSANLTKAVERLKCVMDSGCVVKAGVLSGICDDKPDVGCARVTSPPEVWRMCPEHWLLIIGRNGNTFVFWDSSRASARQFCNNEFGLLYFNPSENTLTTAPDLAHMGVSSSGFHPGRQKRYQVLALQTGGPYRKPTRSC